jgi:hypothetical protein
VDALAPLIVIVVLAVVVLLVSAPLRRGASSRAHERDEMLRADLETSREAKYREIRDAEMDYRTGKLSEADWRMLDRELRGEAIEILRRLDALGEPAVDVARPPQPPAEPRAEPPVTRPAGE